MSLTPVAAAGATGWTAERVETLTTMWTAGWSAAQIAKALGGVTRSAVLGKVNRLGLSGEEKTIRATASRPQARAKAATPAIKPAPKIAPPPPTKLGLAGNGAVFEQAEPRAPVLPVRLIDDAPGSATIHDLGAHMCKWPIGEPGDEGFTYCGRRQARGPYCAAHADRAFSAPKPGRPRTGNELMRSLRRVL